MGSVNDSVPVSTVVRLDDGWRGASDDEIELYLTVVAVLPTVEEADAEVARLSALNGAHSTYLRAHSRWYAAGRGVHR
jgi:hypothetical protein